MGNEAREFKAKINFTMTSISFSSPSRAYSISLRSSIPSACMRCSCPSNHHLPSPTPTQMCMHPHKLTLSWINKRNYDRSKFSRNKNVIILKCTRQIAIPITRNSSKSKKQNISFVCIGASCGNTRYRPLLIILHINNRHI